MIICQNFYIYNKRFSTNTEKNSLNHANNENNVFKSQLKKTITSLKDEIEMLNRI